jgi:hypothetical protein
VWTGGHQEASRRGIRAVRGAESGQEEAGQGGVQAGAYKSVRNAASECSVGDALVRSAWAARGVGAQHEQRRGRRPPTKISPEATGQPWRRGDVYRSDRIPSNLEPRRFPGSSLARVFTPHHTTPAPAYTSPIHCPHPLQRLPQLNRFLIPHPSTGPDQLRRLPNVFPLLPPPHQSSPTSPDLSSLARTHPSTPYPPPLIST